MIPFLTEIVEFATAAMLLAMAMPILKNENSRRAALYMLKPVEIKKKSQANIRSAHEMGDF